MAEPSSRFREAPEVVVPPDIAAGAAPPGGERSGPSGRPGPGGGSGGGGSGAPLVPPGFGFGGSPRGKRKRKTGGIGLRRPDGPPEAGLGPPWPPHGPPPLLGPGGPGPRVPQFGPPGGGPPRGPPVGPQAAARQRLEQRREEQRAALLKRQVAGMEVSPSMLSPADWQRREELLHSGPDVAPPSSFEELPAAQHVYWAQPLLLDHAQLAVPAPGVDRAAAMAAALAVHERPPSGSVLLRSKLGDFAVDADMADLIANV